VFDDRKQNKSNMFKSLTKYPLFSSTFSLSSSSMVGSQSTTSTYLTTCNETTIGTDIYVPSEQNGHDLSNNNEPWFIEPHQIKLGKVIGTVFNSFSLSLPLPLPVILDILILTSLMICKGCYGEVLKATLTLCAGLKEDVVAVKRIKAAPFNSDTLSDMKREIEIMKKLSHKNIVEIKGFVEGNNYHL